MYKQAIRKYAAEYEDELNNDIEDQKRKQYKHRYEGTIIGGLTGLLSGLTAGKTPYSPFIGTGAGALGGWLLDEASENMHRKGYLSHPTNMSIPVGILGALTIPSALSKLKEK